eukprot:CAMPEP_0194495690 /NCGR_PEP_ID=MMETSP0253-20130528/13201_1 /TAXON_ID=2966 /ORGANISM="Noctiluca scintillans" /LENGTH=773 /DNA_ID=CAMNT_0039336983 /DNA_START=50 /DNA_END=2371 /DNA_ORIENTATION=-
MVVAILGGTLSGVALAKKLAAQGHHVHMFRNVNDPKRSISSLHAICEYQTATFVVQADSREDFKSEVREWIDLGLVEDAASFRSATMSPDGKIEQKSLPHSCQRIRPIGGFFALLDSLVQRLPETVKVEAHQIERLSKAENTWTLYGRNKRCFGPYSSVIFAFDAIPRASRKASQKQLLERALPLSAGVIASSAYAVMSSCMAIVLHFEPALEVPFDTIVFESDAVLKFMSRNPKGDQMHRNLQEKNDTWTLVATPEWSLKQRPDAWGVDQHSVRMWDKKKVGSAMLLALERALGQNLRRARQIIPTFHWEGCSYLTQVVDGPQCAFDASAGLGWCGDMFGGAGPAGAVASASDMCDLLSSYHQDEESSSLPAKSQWGPRSPSHGDEDTLSIIGPETGRSEPKDGLDHTWETAVRIAGGIHVRAADSYKKFRKSGPTGNNVPHGPWDGRRSSGMSLTCERIDDGLLKLTGVSKDMQHNLLKASFPRGTVGVCGGLWDPKKQLIDLGSGDCWKGSCPRQVTIAELGLHGSHVLEWDSVPDELAEVLQAIRHAVPEPKILQHFEPDCARLTFENMCGRTIQRDQTLCGWSRDNDRVNDQDDSPKIMIVLGKSKISRGFKYRKEDRLSLDVSLSPGDILLLHGDARRWVSAVNGFEELPHVDSPFDFVHLWLLDHRQLQKLRPSVYNSIHHPAVPRPGGVEYKWMQFTYTVLDETDSMGYFHVELNDGTSPPEDMKVESGEGKEGKDTRFSQLTAKRRRWHAKRVIVDSDFQALGA